jgi:3-phenylpropionate/cinnamic acid dioxygenase small subunit
MVDHDLSRDRAEIVALINRYAELLDGGQLDEVAALFDRATWRASRTGVTLSTPEEVRAVYRNVILYEDGTPRTRHLLTNVTVDVDDDGVAASSSCYFTVLQGVAPGEPIQPILSGRYVDRFAKGPDGWHFTDRLFHADLIGDQSRHFRDR